MAEPLSDQPVSPDLNRSLYGTEDAGKIWEHIHQGNLSDCWFVAAVVALARFRPDEVLRLVRANGDGTYDVAFPGREPVRGVFVTDAEITAYRRPHHKADGLLLPVLEKAYGLLLNARSRAPFEEINAGAARAGKGIRLLTGHRTRFAYLTRGPFGWWLRALRRHVAGATGATPPRVMIVSDTNFRTGHLYAVVDYRPDKDLITLKDPYAEDVRPPLPLEEFVKGYTFAFWEDTR